MIGILKPVKNELEEIYINGVNNMHCCGCVSVKKESSSLLSLFYIYEADFLLYLYFGLNKIYRPVNNVLCTGFPLQKKSVFNLLEQERKVVFAFSVIAAYAFLDDQIRDDDSIKAKFFIKLYKKYFDSSLEFLNCSDKLIYSPKNLYKINENSAMNIQDTALLYRPLTANLYYNSLKKLGTKTSDNLLYEISINISDILTYTDAIADFYKDKLENNFNPIKNENELKIATNTLQNYIRNLSILISLSSQPYKSIMLNILTYGIFNYINKKKAKYGSTNSN